MGDLPAEENNSMHYDAMLCAAGRALWGVAVLHEVIRPMQLIAAQYHSISNALRQQQQHGLQCLSLAQ